MKLFSRSWSVCCSKFIKPLGGIKDLRISNGTAFVLMSEISEQLLLMFHVTIKKTFIA